MTDLSQLPVRPALRFSNDARSDAPAPGAALVLRVQAAVLSHERLSESATAFASELCAALRCERVSVGLLERGYARVIAMSHGADFDARSDLLERIGAAMDEAIEQGVTVALPPLHEASAHVTLANGELMAHAGGSVCTVPLAANGRMIGAVTLERESGSFGKDDAALAEDIACFAGPVLQLKRSSDRSWVERLGESLRASRARLLGPGHLGLKLAAYGTLVMLTAALFVPVTHHVGAPGRLEGSVQRVVVAPNDGFLQQINARPGDRVRRGQVLAELALQDLQVERRRREAELTQQENAYKAALARSDRTLLVIHYAKASEARAHLDLIDKQMARAQIEAPFDGVVIKGDLTQALGAPVQRGEVLMTLAPSEHFRLIIEVDERDIAHVRPGLRGRLALASAPGEGLAFSVERILPVATSAEGRNFFEVEAKLEAGGGALRPGLRGVARIDAGQRSTLWLLTHRLLDWLRLKTWSFGSWS